jgi:hypothetical protein
MKTPCHNFFLKLNSGYTEIINQSFASNSSGRLSEMYQFIEDLNQWCKILERHTDTTILSSAVQEYELGFQAAINGQYRYAFVAQRYFIEQICRFIYLSTNELYLRHWKIGLRDIAWAAIIDEDNGIFSKMFIRAFYDEIENEGCHLLSIVKSMYRESSEFIHGNFSKIKTLPRQLKYDNDLLSKWLDGVETSKFISSFVLFMRFSKSMNIDELGRIHDSVIYEIGEIEEFRELLG